MIHKLQVFPLTKSGSDRHQKNKIQQIIIYKIMSEKYRTQMIIFATTIMLYAAITNTDTSIISQFTHQNGSDWAGPLLTGLFFLGSGICSTRNWYIGKYQYRYCIFIGSLGSLLYIILGLVFIKIGYSIGTTIMVLIGGFLGGCLVSAFYNTIYNYINLLGHEDHQEIKYFCIAIGIINCSNLVGSLISTGLISSLEQFWYVFVLACLILAISCIFLCFKHQKKQIESDQLESQFQESQKQIFDQEHIPMDSFHRELNPYILTPLYGFTGLNISFIFTAFSIIVYYTFEGQMDDQQLNQLTFKLFLFEGFGEILGGIIIIGYSYRHLIWPRDPINDNNNSRSQQDNLNGSPEFILKIVIVSFMLGVFVVYFASILKNQLLMGLGILIIGITDCVSVSMCLSISGRWKKSGVSAYNFSQCILVFLNSIFMAFVSVEIVTGICILLSMLAFLCLFKYDKDYKKFKLLNNQTQRIPEQ